MTSDTQWHGLSPRFATDAKVAHPMIRQEFHLRRVADHRHAPPHCRHGEGPGDQVR